MRNWLTDPLLALVLLTRLPLPRLPETAFARQSRAAWAYPLVGLVTGGIAAALWVLAEAAGLPRLIAAPLALATMVVITGAMHEDGLADSADGLWGGMDRARRLEIMRDSRIGTYGVLALILVSLLRLLCLSLTGPVALLAASVVSRAPLPLLMWVLPHARSDGLSHGVGRPPVGSVAVALALGIAASLFLTGGQGLAAAALAVLAVYAIARVKLGGQTGDILGAGQQITDLAVLLALVPASHLHT